MIITAGEILVEFVSHEIDCCLSKTTNYSGPYPSGAPAIFANQVARVGAQSAIIGCVGSDPFGELILERLKNDGVSAEFLHKSTEHTTGVAFVSYFTDGSRTFVFHMENTAADQITFVPSLQEGTILHVSGASLGNEKIRKAIMDLVEQAQNNCRISYDPNIRPELMKNASIRSCIDTIIKAADFLLPSEEDLIALYPDHSAETFIEEMLALGKTAVVVKRGAKGVVGSDGSKIVSVEPINVEEVDPTGAGDCFCGTFMGLIDQGYSFANAVEHANIAGALHTTKRGPMEWNPSLAEIQAKILAEST